VSSRSGKAGCLPKANRYTAFTAESIVTHRPPSAVVEHFQSSFCRTGAVDQSYCSISARNGHIRTVCWALVAGRSCVRNFVDVSLGTVATHAAQPNRPTPGTIATTDVSPDVLVAERVADDSGSGVGESAVVTDGAPTLGRGKLRDVLPVRSFLQSASPWDTTRKRNRSRGCCPSDRVRSPRCCSPFRCIERRPVEATQVRHCSGYRQNFRHSRIQANGRRRSPPRRRNRHHTPFPRSR